MIDLKEQKDDNVTDKDDNVMNRDEQSLASTNDKEEQTISTVIKDAEERLENVKETLKTEIVPIVDNISEEQTKLNYSLKPDAKEFVPRLRKIELIPIEPAYQYVNVHPGFVPLPAMYGDPNYNPAFLQTSIPVNYMPHLTNYPQQFNNQTQERNMETVKDVNKEQKLDEEVIVPKCKQDENDTNVPAVTVTENNVVKSIKNEEITKREHEQITIKSNVIQNKNEIDIARIVLKLEEAAREQQQQHQENTVQRTPNKQQRSPYHANRRRHYQYTDRDQQKFNRRNFQSKKQNKTISIQTSPEVDQITRINDVEETRMNSEKVATTALETLSTATTTTTTSSARTTISPTGTTTSLARTTISAAKPLSSPASSITSPARSLISPAITTISTASGKSSIEIITGSILTTTSAPKAVSLTTETTTNIVSTTSSMVPIIHPTVITAKGTIPTRTLTTSTTQKSFNYSETLKKKSIPVRCPRYERHANKEIVNNSQRVVKKPVLNVQTQVKDVKQSSNTTTNQWISVSSRKRRKNKIESDSEINLDDIPQTEEVTSTNDVEEEINTINVEKEILINNEETCKQLSENIANILKINQVEDVRKDILEEVKEDVKKPITKSKKKSKKLSQKPQQRRIIITDPNVSLEDAVEETKQDDSSKETISLDTASAAILTNIPNGEVTKESESVLTNEETSTNIEQDSIQSVKENALDIVVKIEEEITLNEEESEEVKCDIPEVTVEEIDEQKTENVKTNVVVEEELNVTVTSQTITPERKRSKKKKPSKTITKNPSTSSSNTTINALDDSYDFLLDNSLLEDEKTNIEISQELDKMIQRGLYSNLEEKIKSLNFKPESINNDGFFKTLNFTNAHQYQLHHDNHNHDQQQQQHHHQHKSSGGNFFKNNRDLSNLFMQQQQQQQPQQQINQAAQLFPNLLSATYQNIQIDEDNVDNNHHFDDQTRQEPSTSSSSNFFLNDVTFEETTKPDEPSTLTMERRNFNKKSDGKLKNKSKRNVDDYKSSNDNLYPITQAVKDWMTKTRETTPEVEILKSPSTIYREFMEVDETGSESVTLTSKNDEEDTKNVKDEDATLFSNWSVSRENSVENDLLDCWEEDVVFDNTNERSKDDLKGKVEECKKKLTTLNGVQNGDNTVQSINNGAKNIDDINVHKNHQHRHHHHHTNNTSSDITTVQNGIKKSLSDCDRRDNKTLDDMSIIRNGEIRIYSDDELIVENRTVDATSSNGKYLQKNGLKKTNDLNDKIEEAEDCLEIYESKYGKNEDYLKLKAEIEEHKRNGTFPKHGNLPYRAICCSLM